MLYYNRSFLVSTGLVLGLFSGCISQRHPLVPSGPYGSDPSIYPYGSALSKPSKIYRHVAPSLPIVPGNGKIKLVVSVDWEGKNLAQNNLQTLTNFRTYYPELYLWHFLNPAYFVKPGADESLIQSQIRLVIRDGDELGLHLHGWKRLFESANVVFKPEGNMSRWPLDCDHDCGHAVPITDYSVEELRLVFRKSIQIQTQQGFPQPTSFRAGAWLGAPHVLEALVAEGFVIDSSEVPIQLFNLSSLNFSYLTLGTRLLELWNGVSPTAQPHYVETAQGGRILEHPDNGLLADWITAERMYGNFVAMVNEYATHPDQNFYVHVGFHQETAFDCLPRLKEAIDNILDYSVRFNVPLQMAHFPENLVEFEAASLSQ